MYRCLWYILRFKVACECGVKGSVILGSLSQLENFFKNNPDLNIGFHVKQFRYVFFCRFHVKQKTCRIRLQVYNRCPLLSEL